MKDYYNLFAELTLLQCTEIDYTDKRKVKSSNAAFIKLDKLQEEMKQNVSDDVWRSLLCHKDDRVKVNAASFCLRSGILVECAVLTLKRVIDDSDDSTMRFSAKMLLKNCQSV